MCDSYVSYFTTKGGTELCFVAKAADLSKSVVICYFNDWVICLDPIVLSRGSLKIRKYEAENPYVAPHHVRYMSTVMEALRSPTEDPMFQSPINNSLFSEYFSFQVLSRLPIDEMMHFATKSLKDARIFFERPKERISREKKYKDQIRNLNASIQKRNQKKKAKRTQARYNY